MGQFCQSISSTVILRILNSTLICLYVCTPGSYCIRPGTDSGYVVRTGGRGGLVHPYVVFFNGSISSRAVNIKWLPGYKLVISCPGVLQQKYSADDLGEALGQSALYFCCSTPGQDITNTCMWSICRSLYTITLLDAILLHVSIIHTYVSS